MYMARHVLNTCVSTRTFERIRRILRKLTTVKFFVDNQQWCESHPFATLQSLFGQSVVKKRRAIADLAKNVTRDGS
jgi:hypothetical protein